MSEKLKPCPRCGSRKRLAAEQVTKTEWQRKCNRCQFSTGACASKEEALAVWNALPRRLRPTTNAPTSGGWYYVRNKGHRHWRIIHIHEADLYDYTRFYADIEAIAGPIPEPEDVK